MERQPVSKIEIIRKAIKAVWGNPSEIEGMSKSELLEIYQEDFDRLVQPIATLLFDSSEHLNVEPDVKTWWQNELYAEFERQSKDRDTFIFGGSK